MSYCCANFVIGLCTVKLARKYTQFEIEIIIIIINWFLFVYFNVLMCFLQSLPVILL
jgi:hypothetical protein